MYSFSSETNIHANSDPEGRTTWSAVSLNALRLEDGQDTRGRGITRSRFARLSPHWFLIPAAMNILEISSLAFMGTDTTSISHLLCHLSCSSIVWSQWRTCATALVHSKINAWIKAWAACTGTRPFYWLFQCRPLSACCMLQL
jgi:hypothetical protein